MSHYLSASWPEETFGHFIPFVGRRYEEGLEGVGRVLVLGESHYDEDYETSFHLSQRDYTQRIGKLMESKGEGRYSTPFFRKLDQALTGQQSPNVVEAADAWSRIAFANFIPQFVGKDAKAAKLKMHWQEANRVFPSLINQLCPNVILVLGLTTWRQLAAGERTEWSSYVPKANETRWPKARDIWRMRYEGGYALSTWVYHPSWPFDGWKAMSGTLRHLIQCRLAI